MSVVIATQVAEPGGAKVEGQAGEILSQKVVAHTFNPSTWEAEAGGFLNSRPVWSTE